MFTFINIGKHIYVDQIASKYGWQLLMNENAFENVCRISNTLLQDSICWWITVLNFSFRATSWPVTDVSKLKVWKIYCPVETSVVYA